MTSFEIGKTYQTSSPGDANCVIRATIVSRTAKTVKVEIRNAVARTFRLSVWEGVEEFKPWGSYSLCPVMQADRIAA